MRNERGDDVKIYDRRERADRHFRNIGIETLQEVYENVEKHYNGGRIGGTDYFTLTSLLYDAIHNERTATETCNGCRWRGRHQKCSCCRRNRSMRDSYEEVERGKP